MTISVWCALGVTARAWGPAVHAYVGLEIGSSDGRLNRNQVYGAIAPDVVNYMFSSPHQADLYQATHFNFLPLWANASNRVQQALARGFSSHNMAWGADFTAHTSSLTLDPSRGYVIIKAELLAAELEANSLYALARVPHDLTLQVAHELVEVAVDVLMQQSHPTLGHQLTAAVVARDSSYSRLFTRTYAAPLAPFFGDSAARATVELRHAEQRFRQLIIAYGHGLAGPPAQVVNRLATQEIRIAKEAAKAYGIQSLPPNSLLKPMFSQFVLRAMTLCQPDFAAEVNATVAAVAQELQRHGITDPVP